MEITTKEVYFQVYCPKCKYHNTPETEEPCNECLSNGFNYDSHKPVNFKHKENEK